MIEPFLTGMLPVGDGHSVYFECVGSTAGRPVLYLHGGPGGGAGSGARRWFSGDLLGVLMDQRGCGRSGPLVTATADLAVLTTERLIADCEALRAHLGIERWAVVGVSWGTTLAMAYAHAHPERVSGMVLALVGTTSAAEVQWTTEGVGRLFPQAWQAFRSAVPEPLRGLRLVDAYANLLADPDPEVVSAAAKAWCDWEDAHVSLSPGHRPSSQYEDPEFRVRFARMVTHFWRHGAFLEGKLLEQAQALAHIPSVLIHGRYDVSSPMAVPYALHRQWPLSRLVVLDDAGHGNATSFPAAVAAAITSLGS